MGLKPGPKPVAPPKAPLNDVYSLEYAMQQLRADVEAGKNKRTPTFDKPEKCVDCGMDTVWIYHRFEWDHDFRYCCICDQFYIHVYQGVVREIKP